MVDKKQKMRRKKGKGKVYLIYDFLTEGGGLERLMAMHGKALKKAGYDVKLLFGVVDEKLAKEDMFSGLKIEDFSKTKGSELRKIILNMLGKNKLEKYKEADCFISYSFPSNFLIRRFKTKKIMYMNHYPNFLYLPFKQRVKWIASPKRVLAFTAGFSLGGVLKKLDKKLVEALNLVFINGRFTKKNVENIYNFRKWIINYSPASGEFKKIDKKKTRYVLDKYNIKGKFILNSGRIIPDKRVDWLTKSFAMVSGKNKEVELIICGHGDKKYIKKLKKMIKELRIEKRARILGFVPKQDLLALYNLAEIFAFPTPKEDLGCVPLEAMICGTPCVAWRDGGGPTETMTDNVSGLLAKPYDLRDFAEKMLLMLKQNFKKKNQNKIIKAVEKFTEKVQSKEFVKEVKKILIE